MPRDIAEHLTFLYGAERAAALAPRIEALIRKYRRVAAYAPTPGPRKLARTEGDAVLITYGDQVREPGEHPLRTLVTFLDAHAPEVVTGVHILPFYPYSSDDGFSVIDYYAVDPKLGTWEDVHALGRRFHLMFDAVLNHCSAESAWFQRFLEGDPAYRDWFVTVDGGPDLSQVVRPRALPLLTTFQSAKGPVKVWTTFSPDQVDLNVRNPEVLLAMLDVLLFYVSQGAQYIRLDAIAYLWKELGTRCIHLPQTHRVIELMRAVLDHAAPDVLLITETNVPHPDNVAYFGDGSHEAQLVYNFALPPLVLHSIATGSAKDLSRWAALLTVPSHGVTFFNFLASHDGIGVFPLHGLLPVEEVSRLIGRVEAHGGFVSYRSLPDGSERPYELNINYFDALSDPAAGEPLELQVARFLVAHAIQMALAGVPGIYFHSLFGSRGDPAAVEESGVKRRINRQKLAREDLERDLADPASRRSQILAGFQRLMAARRSTAAFHPNGAQTVLTLDPRVFALLRTSPDEEQAALCLHNVSDEPVRLEAKLVGRARELAEQHGLYPSGSLRLDLQPYEVRWLLSGAQVPDKTLSMAATT